MTANDILTALAPLTPEERALPLYIEGNLAENDDATLRTVAFANNSENDYICLSRYKMRVESDVVRIVWEKPATPAERVAALSAEEQERVLAYLESGRP